ncbi:hypothetical protein DFH27DRAFT_555140 [Peziza echinospora]|nr:hypothetical protein DFH27DRAFT_555140 [Peziza echinospora]
MEGVLNRLVREVGNLRVDMNREIGVLRVDMNQRDTNAFARTISSKFTSDTTLLEPLVGRDGQEIPNFPETSADIHNMASDTVNNVLNSLGLPLGGRIDVRKNRIR